MKHKEGYDLQAVHLLRTGRHFRLRPGVKVIPGRNQEENALLQSLATEKDTLLQELGFKGPTALSSKVLGRREMMQAASLILRYADLANGNIQSKGPSGMVRLDAENFMDEAAIEHLRIRLLDKNRLKTTAPPTSTQATERP